jgi:hypothetical protein
MARTMLSGVLSAVITMTFASGRISRMRRSSSSPSMPGMRTSVSTTS